jgi:hypothetical protein
VIEPPVDIVGAIVMHLGFHEVSIHFNPSGKPERPVRPGRVKDHIRIKFSSHEGFLEEIDYQIKASIPEGFDGAVQFGVDKIFRVLFEIDIGGYVAVPFEENIEISTGCSTGNTGDNHKCKNQFTQNFPLLLQSIFFISGKLSILLSMQIGMVIICCWLQKNAASGGGVNQYLSYHILNIFFLPLIMFLVAFLVSTTIDALSTIHW